MARRPRMALGGRVNQVMKRVSGKQGLFEDSRDCEAFERAPGEAKGAKTGPRKQPPIGRMDRKNAKWLPPPFPHKRRTTWTLLR